MIKQITLKLLALVMAVLFIEIALPTSVHEPSHKYTVSFNDHQSKAEQFRRTLAPPDPSWGGTGALYRARKENDLHLEFNAKVSAQLEQGLPSSYYVLDLSQIVTKYDQGYINACVAYSDATAKSIEDYLDVGQWNKYDALEIYYACGGDNIHGINTDQSLNFIRSLGCLEIGSSRRWTIENYLFAPESSVQWRNTLAAALMTTGPCVVATLLPSQFGWDSNTTLTSAYHQMCLVGYEGLGDDDYAVFLNTWGWYFGNNGFVRLKWSMLESGGSFQNGFVYAYAMIDTDDGDFIPPPPPPPPVPVKPIITKVRYKNNRKIVVTGVFDADATLFLDGVETSAAQESGWFALKAKNLTGTHTVKVVNDNGQSVEQQFIAD
jgi:hypothetical protein